MPTHRIITALLLTGAILAGGALWTQSTPGPATAAPTASQHRSPSTARAPHKHHHKVSHTQLAPGATNVAVIEAGVATTGTIPATFPCHAAPRVLAAISSGAGHRTAHAAALAARTTHAAVKGNAALAQELTARSTALASRMASLATVTQQIQADCPGS